MHIVASTVVLASGLYVALLADDAGELRVFGWMLVAIGLLGLLLRWWMVRVASDRDDRRHR
jgi:uncharacterized membrane protein